VSQQWLLAYIKKLYENLPADLNADLTLPDLGAYLSDRMDEEIGRIEAIKKIRLHYRNMFKFQKMSQLQKVARLMKSIWLILKITIC
jgi:hypothetical protein